ncbi:MAG TPA: glucose/quinate/shikimate family membrane-bound PQQ-dependent dehydrogenase [Dongiaceae bacterium]
MMKTQQRPLILLISGAVTVLFGLSLIAGGAWLLALGGSWYYLLAGIGIAATGLLVIARRAEAYWVYAAVVLGTLAWAIFEIGFDWWPLVPRGDLVFIIGLYLLMPWIARHLRRPVRGVTEADVVVSPSAIDVPETLPKRNWRGTGLPLTISLLLAAVVGIVAMLLQHDNLAGTLTSSVQLAAGDSSDIAPSHIAEAGNDWRAYGGSEAGDRYSSLTQITPDNVGKLKVAWTYHTKDIRGPNDPIESTYELTPLKVGDSLYLCTPHDQVIALDAETGAEQWKYDPQMKEVQALQHLTCRGVSYHDSGASGAPGDCGKRIFLPTADARLIALDAGTGEPCEGFGDHGQVNLWLGMPKLQPGFYYSTSAPAITRNLVIIAGNVTDNASTYEPSGVVRAYDVNTGALVWNWDSGNPDDTAPLAPGKTYTPNSPNSWSTASVDEILGMIYLPMGNAPPDQWGAKRTPNTEKFSAAIVALDLATGKVRWVYQTVHHDLWDMDVGSQPSLVDLDMPSGRVPALVAPTKAGDLYVLDRRTGQPVIPAPEQPVPQGAAQGDHTAPTQPFSLLSFKPAPLTERDMWGVTPFDQLACRIAFQRLRYEGMFTPPSVQGSLVYPGNLGGFDWGGIAVDPERQIAFANPDYMAFVSRLIPQSADLPADFEAKINRENVGASPNFGVPFKADLHPFLSVIGLPCQSPPWGYVAGVDLKTGQIVYQHKNGTVRDSSPVPFPFKMGVPTLGGPIMTAGGVAFMSGTLDYYIRAYDVATGTQLWEDRLPAGGQATPMTYMSAKSGRQFLIVVAGGHGSLPTKPGDSIIAYALPK